MIQFISIFIKRALKLNFSIINNEYFWFFSKKNTAIKKIEETSKINVNLKVPFGMTDRGRGSAGNQPPSYSAR